MQFQLFDAVELNEALPLADGSTAAAGTPGAIVEILGDGTAYMVELFDGWVTVDGRGNLIPGTSDTPKTFVKTIGLEVVQSQQIRLLKPAEETVGIRPRLWMALEELPDALAIEVVDFAEFLRQKHQRRVVASDREYAIS